MTLFPVLLLIAVFPPLVTLQYLPNPFMFLVKRLKLLPGVTTLFRDFTGGLSLVPLITYSF